MKQKLFPLYNLGENKPYWDGELQTLRHTMHNDEKTYIRCKDKKQRNYYRTHFIRVGRYLIRNYIVKNEHLKTNKTQIWKIRHL